MKNLNVFSLYVCLLMVVSCTAQTSKSNSQPSSGAGKLENRFSDGVIGMHNTGLIQDLLADDFVSHQFPTPGINNKAAFTAGIAGLLAGFPDIKITRVEQHEIGDKVYTYAFWEGTQTGAFMGVPATGKKVHVEYMDIWRAKEGKIAENWVIMDVMGLMIQLGVVPPPGAGK